MSTLLEHIQNNPQDSQRLIGIKYEQLQKLLKQAIELNKHKQDLSLSKKVRIIAPGGGRKPKLSPEEQIILTLTYLRHLTTFQCN
ncbi:MAG: DDE transposase family protein [Calothrix sp. MO_167.B12]|nr:DDE transposase family protein [Calothrix sp. MO_167.B12]